MQLQKILTCSPLSSQNYITVKQSRLTVRTMKRKLSSEYENLEHEHLIDLPASTHTFLHTEPIFSVAFVFSLGIAVLSAMCLFLVLINEIKEGEDGNRLALPHGITPSVVAAQYCGELHVKQYECIEFHLDLSDNLVALFKILIPGIFVGKFYAEWWYSKEQ